MGKGKLSVDSIERDLADSAPTCDCAVAIEKFASHRAGVIYAASSNASRLAFGKFCEATTERDALKAFATAFVALQVSLSEYVAEHICCPACRPALMDFAKWSRTATMTLGRDVADGVLGAWRLAGPRRWHAWVSLFVGVIESTLREFPITIAELGKGVRHG